MFGNCSSLQKAPMLNTDKCDNFYAMFQGCSALKTLPQYDTSNGVTFTAMLGYCKSLVSLPLFDFSKCENINDFFGWSDIETLTSVGGFKNLSTNWDDDCGLCRLPNLTYESIINIINNLANVGGDTKTLKLHNNALSQLTDADKELATSKGWILTA